MTFKSPQNPINFHVKNLQCEVILHSSTKSCFDVHTYVQLTKLTIDVLEVRDLEGP